MRDRVPAPGRENRVKLTQDDGTVLSGVLAYDDQATQEGSTYTKGNVLPDDACDLLLLDREQAEPKDAFMILGLLHADVYGRVEITVRNSSNQPVSGISFLIGTVQVKTDANGVAYTDLPVGSYTARFTSALDISFSQSTLSVAAVRGKISRYTVTANTYAGNQRTFTTSGEFKFSENVESFDVFCVGGGGSGAAATMLFDTEHRGAVAATGGASGFTKTLLNYTTNLDKPLVVTIGAGGPSVTGHAEGYTDIGGTFSKGQILGDANGADGGATSVSLNGTVICTANGGKGGEASSSTSTGSFGLFYGAKGGNGSAAAGGDAKRSGSSWGAYSWIQSVCGKYGTVDPIYYDDEGTQGTNEGYSQGYTNKAFEEDSGAAYGIPGQSCAAIVGNGNWTQTSSGNSTSAKIDSDNSSSSWQLSSRATNGANYGDGGGAAGALLRSTATTYNKEFNAYAYSGAGKQGLVIIRWRYKS